MTSKRSKAADQYVQLWMTSHPGRKTELQRSGELFVAYEAGYEEALDAIGEFLKERLLYDSDSD